MNQLPPGPNSHLIWQTLRWTFQPLKFLDDCQAIYGDTFTLRFVDSRPRVIISNPQDIKKIFSLDSQSLQAGRGNQILLPVLGQNSLFTLDGEKHQHHRKLLMPPFAHQYIKNYCQIIIKIAQEITNQWESEKPFDIRSQMQKISLEIIIRLVLGINDSTRYRKIKKLIISFLNIMDSPLKSAMIFFPFLQLDCGQWTWWGQFKQIQRQIDQVLQEEIEARRNQPSAAKDDVLGLMMNVKDEEGNSLDDRELKDELATLFIAGHETLTTSLSWAFYQIHQHPEIKEKLQSEIDHLDYHHNLMEVEKLPYLTATIKETLRMYPISPIIFPRVVRKRITINTYTYPQDTILCLSLYLVHYREDIYAQPHQFQPARFINRKYSPSEYFPFGGGSRLCLGYALAQLEMKLIISMILYNHQLKLLTPANVTMRRRSFGLSPNQEIMFMKIA